MNAASLSAGSRVQLQIPLWFYLGIIFSNNNVNYQIHVSKKFDVNQHEKDND